VYVCAMPELLKIRQYLTIHTWPLKRNKTKCHSQVVLLIESVDGWLMYKETWLYQVLYISQSVHWLMQIVERYDILLIQEIRDQSVDSVRQLLGMLTL
jgi:hypothetical protein